MKSQLIIQDLTLGLLLILQLQKVVSSESVSAHLKSRLLRNSTISPRTRKPDRIRITHKVSVSPGITFIGAVGNKSYYTDPEKMGVLWAESLDFCHEIGLQPASIESLSEHKLVRNYLANLPHRFFWLAGTDYFHEGSWKWLQTGENFKYTKWTQGFPSKSRKNNCLYLSYGNDGWIDASCSSIKLIIRPLCQSIKFNLI
ncbi:unnamed protein product [Orchesella dallaii]|uniref:C-type lectin domain-containing protein n=1 Tax=Orchesella dallaii TaxID=48710 RepID=A0ABP1PNA3_9HEXA